MPVTHFESALTTTLSDPHKVHEPPPYRIHFRIHFPRPPLLLTLSKTSEALPQPEPLPSRYCLKIQCQSRFQHPSTGALRAPQKFVEVL